LLSIQGLFCLLVALSGPQRKDQHRRAERGGDSIIHMTRAPIERERARRVRATLPNASLTTH